jgi:RNA polymerase sigma-70 factor (ECF subfamily)
MGRASSDELDAQLDLEYLLARVADQDAVAFRELHDATRARLFALIYKVVRDVGYAEETLQEVYLEIWLKAGNYQPELGKPISWLMMICHRRAVDRVRSEERLRRKTALLAMISCDIDAGGADEPLLLRDEYQRLLHHLSALTHRQRQSINLVYFADLTQREAAKQLNILVPALKTRLRDGVLRLRTQLRSEV